MFRDKIINVNHTAVVIKFITTAPQQQYLGHCHLSVVCRNGHGPHQLQAGIRARSYRALEWGRFPSNTSIKVSTNTEGTKQPGSQNRHGRMVTYLAMRSSVKLASSFSLIGAPISKRVRIHATLRKMARRAKNLPGQILSNESLQYSRTPQSQNPHLLPAPNDLSSGFLTEGSSFPSFRNRSGSNIWGSG